MNCAACNARTTALRIRRWGWPPTCGARSRRCCSRARRDDEIRAFMVQRYGNVILFTPPLKRLDAWVWMLPVLAVLAGASSRSASCAGGRRLVDTDDSVVDPEERRAMILAFVLIAGTLAAAAALLLLLPLLRRREDARPAAAMTAIAVLLVMLLGGAGCTPRSAISPGPMLPRCADTPAAMTARLAKRLASESGTVEDWLQLGRSYACSASTPGDARLPARRPAGDGAERRSASWAWPKSLVQQDVEELRGRAGRMFERALETRSDLAQGPVLQRFRRPGPQRIGAGAEALQAAAGAGTGPDVRALLENAESPAPPNRKRASRAKPRRTPARERESRCTSPWRRRWPREFHRARHFSLQRAIPNRRGRRLR